MSIIIKKMDASIGTAKNDIAGVFVEGYYDILSTLCKDKKKLINAFESAVNENVFYVALDGNKPVGITACSNNKHRALDIEIKKFRENLGFIKGSIAYSFMGKEFTTPLTHY
jgi:hypothetical protein